MNYSRLFIRMLLTILFVVVMSATAVHADWQSVGTGDCPGRDVANSRGPNPEPAKCNDRFRGLTAVCWSGECTYKNIETAACTGGANPGRMYTCADAKGARGRRLSGPEVEIFRNGNDQGVANGGQPARFTLDRTTLITRILCYHYNGGRGAPGGTISIHTETGKWIGSWPARAENNLHWVARPDIVLQPGRYIVVDSDPSTWSQNGGSSGEGHVIINGVISNDPAPSAPPAARRPGVDPVGVWRHGSTETWTITQSSDGGYLCQESGFGFASARGQFTADGRFRMDYTTRDGRIRGWYEMTFAPDGRTASGRWQETSGSSNGGSSSWARVR